MEIPTRPSEAAGGSAHNVLSATHTDSAVASLVRGDLLVVDSTPELNRLPVGSANEFLAVNAGGTDPEWRAITESDITDLDHDAAKIQGKAVTITALADEDFLVYDVTGDEWRNRKLVAGDIPDISGTYALASHNHAASEITSGTFADARIAQSNVTQHEAAIDHDALTGFVADEHIAHSGVTLTAGVGLTGGGTIAASRTFDLDINGLTEQASPTGAADYVAIYDAGLGAHRKVLLDNLPGSGGASALDDLSDVTITTAARGNILYRNASLWVNLSLGANLTVLASDGTDAAWTALSTAHIQSGTFADARISQSSVTQHEGAIDHDALTNFVANEHIDWTQDQGATDIHSGNIPDLSGTYATVGHNHSGTYQPLDAALTDISGLTLASGDILYVDGSGNIVNLAKGSNGEVLKLSAGFPVWQAEGGGTSHDLLSATHTDVVASAVSRGSIIVGNATPAWAELAVGTNLQVLATDGTDAAWTSLTASHIQSGTFADARIAESNVTQHQAALSITESQISDLGTYQTQDATLTSLAALGTVADRIAYTTGVDTWAETALTSFARTILDDADAATVRGTIGAPATGDVTASGLTMATDRLLGRETASTGAIEELALGTGLDLNSGLQLVEFVGDSGAGGSIGAVPAPSAGDAAAGKFLKADGTWAAPAGGSGAFTSSGGSIDKATTSDQIILSASGSDEVQLRMRRGSDTTPAANILEIVDAAAVNTLFAIDKDGKVESIALLTYDTMGDTYPVAEIGNATLQFGAGGASALDLGVERNAAGVLAITDAAGGRGTILAPSQKVNSLSDAATISVNCANGLLCRVTITANRTMGAPTNAKDGDILHFEITQGAGGSHTITWNAVYVFSTDVPEPTLSTTAGYVDMLSFRYDSSASKWRCVGTNLGFTG